MLGFYNHIKKSVSLVVGILSFGVTNGQEGSMIGLGPSLEIEESLVGINGRLFYGINESFCFGPEVTFFPKQEINDQYKLSIIDLNVNGHYIFEIIPKLGVYPLSGINYTIETEYLITQSEENESKVAIGWNYGLGAHYDFGSLFAFAEFKGITGELHDEFITIGIIFSLSKTKE